jgi:hypothetical protein
LTTAASRARNDLGDARVGHLHAPGPGAGRQRGDRARPRWAIAAATTAICSALAWTLPCRFALEPTARSSPIVSAAGIVLVAAPSMPGGGVEPEPLGDVDELLGAELGAQGREDRCCTTRRRSR